MTETASGPGNRPGAARGASVPSPPTYQAVRDAVNAQTRMLYRTSIELVQYPAQGDFAWYYRNANQVFNAATYDYVSARVGPGDAPGLVALESSGSFPLAYAALVESVTWTVAGADRGSAAIAAQAAQALAGLARLRAASTHPADGAGGMLTINPVDGSISGAPVPGYSIGSAVPSLATSLQGGGSTITVQVAGALGSVVTLTYPCCTMVPVEPATWQPTSGSGWFGPDPVAQAFARGTGDGTGYAFVVPPAYRPGPIPMGGNLGRIVSVLVSAPPTITVQPNMAHNAFMLTDLRAATMDALMLLGLDRLPVPRRTALALAPTPSVPLLDQRAYVVGVSLATFAGPP